MVGLVNLREQVRLVLLGIDLPQLADVAVAHRADPVLPCIDVLYFATLNRTVGVCHSCCVVDANAHRRGETDPKLVADVGQPHALHGS